MTMHINRIIIHRKRKPSSENVNDEIQWFCESLGLFGNRDKDKSRFRMFITLLKSLSDPEGMTSDEISEKVGLSRGTVVHHLHSLMGAGIVINNRSRYMIRVENLRSLVDEIESDIMKTMEELKDVAESIDKRLRL